MIYLLEIRSWKHFMPENARWDGGIYFPGSVEVLGNNRGGGMGGGRNLDTVFFTIEVNSSFRVWWNINIDRIEDPVKPCYGVHPGFFSGAGTILRHSLAPWVACGKWYLDEFWLQWFCLSFGFLSLVITPENISRLDICGMNHLSSLHECTWAVPFSWLKISSPHVPSANS